MLHGHNQGAALAAAASRWCASGSPRAVVAVDDRSEDETEDLLAALVAEGRPGLRVQRSEFVVGPWESVRRALAELPEVGYVHLPALEAEPQPEAIARALAGAEGAGVVFAPRDRRSALGALLERSGAVWGDAPWSFADSEALAERLGQLPPAFELGPSAWIERRALEAASRAPDRGAWTGEAWVQRAAAAGGLRFWPEPVITLGVRPERLRDTAALGAALLVDFDGLLGELQGAQRAALAAWRPALVARLEALRAADRACVAHGLASLRSSERRRDRWVAAGLRRVLGLPDGDDPSAV